jgi:hypothetical protein
MSQPERDLLQRVDSWLTPQVPARVTASIPRMVKEMVAPGQVNRAGRNRAKPALGTIGRFVSGQQRSGTTRREKKRQEKPRPPTPEERQRATRLRRYQLQNHAARLLPGEKGVVGCLRRPTNVAGAVEVQYVPTQHSAHYRGLQVCKSVWHCPICAAKISERRRDELARLIKKHIAAGGSVYMTTYTIRHGRRDDLEEMVGKFLEAKRKMRMGRRGMALRHDFGVIGTVTVLEVTCSEENGWHPHQHELVFVEGELEADGYEKMARSAWKDAAAKLGLEMNEHGFELQRTYGAVADYIAKYGREPAVENPWGVESEMAKGHIKQGREEQHYTPFAMLAAIADGVTSLEPRFQEYARVFKGRRQLRASPGLMERYQEEEKSDEELAEESQENEAFTILEIDLEPWHQVVEMNVRGSLLEHARAGRVGDCIVGLEELGIESRLADLKGWQVQTPGGQGRMMTVRRCNILHRWRCSVLLEGEDDPGQGSLWRVYDLVDVALVAAPGLGCS